MEKTESILYGTVPGRGMMNSESYTKRMEFLKKFPVDLRPVTDCVLKTEQLKNNIESFIGCVEVPVAIVGPLMQNTETGGKQELFGVIGTTEGALVASINRGAKSINDSGGFISTVVHQKMLRSPMFVFENLTQAVKFDEWIKQHFDLLKKVTAGYSNHANLIEVTSVIIGKIVHLKFIYTTGDASGQNMTTNCTWQACLWIEKQFNEKHDFRILNFVIDGNGSSDKKISSYALRAGRGIHVVAECNLTNETIEKNLRTTADAMFQSYLYSVAMSRLDGIIGYNINMANAIAGFFASAGQDLASIHESATALLQLEKTKDGLYVSLSLPTLCIGTVGGGTHLPAQNAILKLMNCEGTGGVNRFAQIICGFAMSLEISTLAAGVSGQFARAHQKLGRNKPVNWLVRSEIDSAFVRANAPAFDFKNFNDIVVSSDLGVENGILTELTSRISKKLIGFIPVEVSYSNAKNENMLIKSKPTDKEVIKGLHFMASNINSDLADLLISFESILEYNNCHNKEIDVYQFLNKSGFKIIPNLFGLKKDTEREIFVLILEYLNERKFKIFNSENSPELWTPEIVKKAIEAIHSVHLSYLNKEQIPASVSQFYPEKAIPFYLQLNKVNKLEYAHWEMEDEFDSIEKNLQSIILTPRAKHTPVTLIHNDFNPRNIGIRENDSVCIYDWELAVLNIPQRDVIELLSFTLSEDFSRAQLLELLNYHRQLFNETAPVKITEKEWLADCSIITFEYLYSRVGFYLAGGALMDYPFAKRIFQSTNRMLALLNEQ